MIGLKRLNGQDFILNADFIESIESTPDTVIALTTGKKIMVKNSVDEVVQKTIQYKQLCNSVMKVISKEGPRDVKGNNGMGNPQDILKG